MTMIIIGITDNTDTMVVFMSVMDVSVVVMMNNCVLVLWLWCTCTCIFCTLWWFWRHWLFLWKSFCISVVHEWMYVFVTCLYFICWRNHLKVMNNSWFWLSRLVLLILNQFLSRCTYVFGFGNMQTAGDTHESLVVIVRSTKWEVVHQHRLLAYTLTSRETTYSSVRQL